MKREEIVWGLLGTASTNQFIIPAVREVPGNRIGAVASRVRERAEQYAREHAIPRAYGSYAELLADDEVDVVYVPLPNSMHAEWSIKAARAGKHVLCEKPLALCLREAEEMIEAARAAGVLLVEGVMYRHHAITLKVKELIDAGAIGRLFLIRGTFDLNLPYDPTDFRFSAELGGGCLRDVGWYPVSYARYVVGADPLEAFGWQIEGPTGVDLAFVGQLRFPGDVYLQVDSSFQHPSRSPIEFIGSEGTLSLACAVKMSASKEVVVYRGGRRDEIFVGTPDNRYRDQIADIADCLRGNRSPRVPFEESRGTVQAVEALLRSAREGRCVTL